MTTLFFRQAFELAWGNAYIFCRERPYTVYMDDISFEAPVEVGNLLYFNSQISFVHQHYIQVSVIANSRFYYVKSKLIQNPKFHKSLAITYLTNF